VPVCEECGAFDTLSWKLPPHAEDPRIAGSATLPLLVGRDDETAAQASAAAGRGDGPDGAAPDLKSDPVSEGGSGSPEPARAGEVEDAQVADEPRRAASTA
jgi:HemY protein